MEELKKSKLLLAGAQDYGMISLEQELKQAGFVYVRTVVDARETIQLLNSYQPDILFLNGQTTKDETEQTLRNIRERAGNKIFLPIVIIADNMASDEKYKLLNAGANEFISMPFDQVEVFLRIINLLRTRRLQYSLQQYDAQLEEKVLQRTEELQHAKFEILDLLGRAAEYRDDMTGQHTQRVGWLSGKIAAYMNLPEHQVEMIRMAAPLHDIGKIGIPDAVLLKPGRFEEAEFEVMKTHTVIGHRILEGTSFSVLQLAGIIAKYHHEKWDGTGYPEGLKGEQIPLPARIVALADFYDALTHERPYKRAWTPLETLEEVQRQRGKHFDPLVTDAFHELFANEDLSNIVFDEIYAG